MPNSVLEKLRKHLEFLTVAKTGKRCITPAFVVQIYKRPTAGPFRYGVTASRKVGSAIERNRAKRRLRALLKQVLPQVAQQGMDYVLIARKETLKRDFSLMVQELQQALIKIQERHTL